MYRLGLRREFIARHYLVGGDWGAENIEHSHRYQVELVLEKKDLDRHGFLVDIVDVDSHMDAIAAGFQDTTLNALPAFEGVNPSIERLATVIHDLLRQRLAHFKLASLTVTIREDDIAWTSYHSRV